MLLVRIFIAPLTFPRCISFRKRFENSFTVLGRKESLKLLWIVLASSKSWTNSPASQSSNLLSKARRSFDFEDFDGFWSRSWGIIIIILKESLLSGESWTHPFNKLVIRSMYFLQYLLSPKAAWKDSSSSKQCVCRYQIRTLWWQSYHSFPIWKSTVAPKLLNIFHAPKLLNIFQVEVILCYQDQNVCAPNRCSLPLSIYKLFDEV